MKYKKTKKEIKIMQNPTITGTWEEEYVGYLYEGEWLMSKFDSIHEGVNEYLSFFKNCETTLRSEKKICHRVESNEETYEVRSNPRDVIYYAVNSVVFYTHHTDEELRGIYKTHKNNLLRISIGNEKVNFEIPKFFRYELLNKLLEYKCASNHVYNEDQVLHANNSILCEFKEGKLIFVEKLENKRIKIERRT